MYGCYAALVDSHYFRVVKMLQFYYRHREDIRPPQEHELNYSFIEDFVDDPSMKVNTQL